MGFAKTFRDVYSTILLILCTVMIMDSMYAKNTTFAADYHPWVAFFSLWVGLWWLSMVEGGQASLVGLPPVDMQLYQKSHPKTYDIMKVVNKGDNLDRYLMGRQFLVLALVFLENLAGGVIDKRRLILGRLPIEFNYALLDTGLALFFMTAMIGKISAQVNASRCMLDFVNTYVMTFTLYVSMFIEFSGLLHSCYLAQIFFAAAAGQPIESKEDPRTGCQSLFFWIRVLLSLAILAFAFTVTIYCIYNDQTTMYDWSTSPTMTLILFFVFMSIVGMLEGMQIAFFAVAKMTVEERSRSAWAKRTCDVLFANDGRNLPGFMVGRQMCVTLCFFIIAQVTTIKLNEGDENIFGFTDGAQIFFETGLLGALITTIVASIMWQLVASAFPMAFLSTPLTYILLRWCLFLEWTGIMQGSWVFALIIRRIMGYKRDEIFIGTAEERKARAMGDPARSADEDYNVVPGHMYPGVPVLPPTFGGRTENLAEIMQLEQELVDHKQELDSRISDIQAKKERMTSKQIESQA